VRLVTREIVRFSAHNARVPSTDGGRVENGRRRVNAVRRRWRVARARVRPPARRLARPVVAAAAQRSPPTRR